MRRNSSLHLKVPYLCACKGGVMDNKYAPWVRIFARYILGGTFFGSTALGEALAVDPDFIAVGSVALGGAVEAIYAWSKKTNKPT